MKLEEAVQLTGRVKSYYHATEERNLSGIMSRGLIPSMGTRSEKLGDSGIFLFKEMVDLEDALMNWLGDEIDEDSRVAILRVKVPDSRKIRQSPASYEVIYTDIIPPNMIELVGYE